MMRLERGRSFQAVEYARDLVHVVAAIETHNPTCKHHRGVA